VIGPRLGLIGGLALHAGDAGRAARTPAISSPKFGMSD
jgi:hypothetical protein